MLNLSRTLWIAGTLVGLAASAQENFQNGYIVRGQNDTVRGQIDYREWINNPHSVTFRDMAGAKTEYHTDEISAFFAAGDIYRSYHIHVAPYADGIVDVSQVEQLPPPYDTTTFLRLVTGGKLNLYSYHDNSDIQYFFVTHFGEAPVLLGISTTVVEDTKAVERRDDYQYQLARLLADCPSMAKSKIEVAYTEKALRVLVSKYDHCGESLHDNTEKTDRHGRSLFFTPLIGFVHTSVSVNGGQYEAQETWPSYSTVTGGIGIMYLLPRGRGQYSLIANALYQHFYSQGSPLNEGYGLVIQGNFDYSQLQTSVLFRYRYPSEGVRPFAEAGFSGISVFNNKGQRKISGAQTQPLFGNPDGIRNFQTAPVLGLGVEIHRFTLEARASWVLGVTSITTTGANMTHLCLLAGFNF